MLMNLFLQDSYWAWGGVYPYSIDSEEQLLMHQEYFDVHVWLFLWELKAQVCDLSDNADPQHLCK